MGTESGPLVHPNIHSGSDVAPFRFAGRVMGKCLYDSAVRDSHHLLTVHFTRSFLKMILGVPIRSATLPPTVGEFVRFV